MEKKLILFQSVHWVIKAEKFLAEKNIRTKIIAVPKHISSECGMCLVFENTEMETILSLLRNEGFHVDCVSL